MLEIKFQKGVDEALRMGRIHVPLRRRLRFLRKLLTSQNWLEIKFQKGVDEALKMGRMHLPVKGSELSA